MGASFREDNIVKTIKKKRSRASTTIILFYPDVSIAFDMPRLAL